MNRQEFEELELQVQQSELPLKSYLQQIGVSYSTYHYWRRKCSVDRHGCLASHAQGKGYYYRRLPGTERGRASSEPKREVEQHRTYLAVLASWKLRSRPPGQIPAHDDADYVRNAYDKCKELPDLQYGVSGHAGRTGLVRKLRKRPVLCAVFRQVSGTAAIRLGIN